MVATEGFPPGHNGEGRCVCRASQPVSGVDGIRVVENRWSVVWEPGQYTTPASWYPLDGELGLTHPNQSASHVSKNRELWLVTTFLATACESIGGGNQSWPGWWTSGAWVAGSLYVRIRCARPRCAWTPGRVLLRNRVISLASLAFRDPWRRIAVVFSN